MSVQFSHRISLKRRVLNASTWSLAGIGLSQAIRFGNNLLLTRLLVPDMFGVMAIAGMVLFGLAMFSDLGLAPNIIQSKRGSDRAFLNTAWVVQIIRGIALWFVALSVSVSFFLIDRVGLFPKNSAYTDPRLPYVIAVMSLIVLIGGFQSTKLLEARRNLTLGHVTKIEITTQVTTVLFTLGWVSLDRSIWALVAGSVCSSLVNVLLSHAWVPGVSNRWEWDRRAFWEIFHFGKWIFLSSILGFLVSQGDRLLLGSMIDSTLLGVYMIAYLIFNTIEQLLSKIINDVTFSALSEVVRERPANLKASYYRFHAVIAPATYFCSGILMFSGQSMIALLYDHRYWQAGWMLQIIAVALVTIPFRVAKECLLSLGLPRLYAQLIAIRVVSLFLVMPLGFHYFGLPGALWGFVASYFSSIPMSVYYNIKYGLFDLSKELMLLPAWLVGALVAMEVNCAIGP